MQPSDPEPMFLDDEHRLAYTSEEPPEGSPEGSPQGSPQGSSGTGVTLVAIPGNPGSARDFRYLAPLLTSAGMRVIRLDPPGFGGSKREGLVPLDIAGRTSAVVEALEALGLPPVILLSHSAGGMVAARISALHPELVDKVAMIAPPGSRPHFDQRPLAVIGRALRLPGGERLLAPAVRRIFDAQGWPRSLTDRQRCLTILDAAAISFTEHGENLRAMKHPTLVAWARDDAMIPESRFANVAELAPAGPRLGFDSGGHNLQKTRAAEIAEALVEFAQA